MHRVASILRIGLLAALLGMTLVSFVPSQVSARIVAIDSTGAAVDCDPKGDICFYRVEGDVITIFPGTRIVSQD